MATRLHSHSSPSPDHHQHQSPQRSPRTAIGSMRTQTLSTQAQLQPMPKSPATVSEQNTGPPDNSSAIPRWSENPTVPATSSTPAVPENTTTRAASFLSSPPPPQLSIPPTRQTNTHPSPISAAGLRIETNNISFPKTRSASRRNISATYLASPGTARSTSYGDSFSPISAVSPALSTSSASLGSISKMTPLPSPITGGDSPGPWNKYRGGELSRNSSLRSTTSPRTRISALVTSAGESLDAALAAQRQRKSLHSLRGPDHHGPTSAAKFEWEHSNSSNSGLKPPSRSNSRNGHERSPSLPHFDVAHLHRETWQGERRRTSSFSSTYSPALSGSATSISSISSTETVPSAIKKHKLESFSATSPRTGAVRTYRGLRVLGHGAFSRVILATSEPVVPEEVDELPHPTTGEIIIDAAPVTLNPRHFVAVKIVEHAVAGADQKERVESGLKRELDILKSVHHPCLIRLRAWAIEPKRALIVLPYCAGGDLFDVASSQTLAPNLIRRVFAEIVSAVQYLHDNGIVHRDVKLENVLVNLTAEQLAEAAKDPENYPHPITTLTDVGLSRRVNFAENELLTTRCGSDDYASPELIMGMPYDGRQTDAWALGVLLYALMEERLPFDPPPGTAEMKMRSKTAHRIARCEWKWLKLAAGNEYDAVLEGGKRIVEGLLKRALKRWRVPMIAEDEWVKEAIKVEIKEVEHADEELE